MPSGGHNAKPETVLKLHGDYRKDRHADRGPKTGGEPLRKPEMGEIAGRIWDHVTETRRAWLCSSDLESLQSLCECWELRCRALVLVNQDPADKLKRIAFKDYQTLFNQLAARFGLTPADRARLGEGSDVHQAKGELEDMLA